MSRVRLDRRSFLASVAAVGGSLVLGFDIPFGPRATHAATSAREITAWIVIEPDETVIIRVAKSEMGQGSFTALPMLVAEELECDWSKVKAEFAPPHENRKRDRVWGNMSTGASRSVSASQNDLRRAGATARAMLIAAAAARWNVPDAECTAAQGVITHRPSGRRITFGRIAAAAADIAPPTQVALKDPKDWKLIGTRQRRLDVPDKVAGKPIYAIDVQLPNMLYAAIIQCPVFKGSLRWVDESKMSGMKGVRRVVKLADAVAVIADSWWQAQRAAQALPVSWDFAENSTVSSGSIRAHLQAGLTATDARVGRNDGDVERALAHTIKRVEADYEVPFLAHATMEPQNCTAQVTADVVEVWAPTQDGETALAIAADAAGVPPSKVVIHKMMLGGGFGRRGIFQDFVRQAVLIAKEVGQPVKLVWTREEDIRHDFYRPVAMARLVAGLDAAGTPIAWSIRIAGQSIIAAVSPRVMQFGVDRNFLQGLLEDMPYGVPNCLMACRTIASISRCATPTFLSGSGAASTIRRTRSSRKASSTRWPLRPVPIPICSGASCWRESRESLRCSTPLRPVPDGARRRRGAHSAASRSITRKTASARRWSRPLSPATAKCACTASSLRLTPGTWSTRSPSKCRPRAQSCSR